MKQAYVSLVVMTHDFPDAESVLAIDSALARQARAHEIVFVCPFGIEVPPIQLRARGPVTIVTTHLNSKPDNSLIAGLARSVGDFVIEWRGPLNAINECLIAELLGASADGVELVEVLGYEGLTSRAFSRVVNYLRPSRAPVRKSVGRVFSRRALQLLLGVTRFEPQVDVLVAELPIRRTSLRSPATRNELRSLTTRIGDGLNLLGKGTRFGTAIPLAFGGFFAMFGLAAALYALGILLVKDEVPEGWTTLMVVLGLGLGSVLTMLGLTWARIDAIAKGLAGSFETTASVTVLAPSLSNGNVIGAALPEQD